VAEIGAKLRSIRQQLKLSLREVDQLSRRLVCERCDNQSYRVSPSYLTRLERGEHELTVGKLIALAEIYKVPAEELLGSNSQASIKPPTLRELSVPNATMLLTAGPLEDQAKYLLPNFLFTTEPPDDAALLPTDGGHAAEPYRCGIIGKRDLTLAPMIPAGSIVQIGTRKRVISARKDWANEFHRPIYFLMTRDACVCGWCELNEGSAWLTLVPHPLSPTSSRRWKYRTEIETVGTVVAVAIRFWPRDIFGWQSGRVTRPRLGSTPENLGSVSWFDARRQADEHRCPLLSD
jgi:transcriptional regulator with XRE-family HTH domain